MSDPVSSMDVEDVLSSIRRLVSEEAKGAASSKKSADKAETVDIHAATERAVSDAMRDGSQFADGSDSEGVPPSNDISWPEPDAAQSDNKGAEKVAFRHQSIGRRDQAGSRDQASDNDQKLVLTAAFRVPDPAASEAAPQDPASQDKAEPARRPQRPHLRTVSDDALEDTNETPETDVETGTETEPANRPKAFEFAPEESLFDRAKQAMEAIRIEPQRPATGFGIRAPEAPATDNTADETGEAAPFIDVPEAESAAPLRRATTHKFPSADAAQATPDEVAVDAGTDDADHQDDPAEAKEISAASPFSATGRLRQSDASEAELVDQDEQIADEPSTINFTEEDSILDEDTLRDLVSQMVREELQGELGDRITRNVRKLVRREIQRALASREFE